MSSFYLVYDVQITVTAFNNKASLFLCLAKDEDRREIYILWDTGAMVSIMVSDILPFSDGSYCGSNVLVRGIECK